MNIEQAIEDLRFHLMQMLAPFGFTVTARPDIYPAIQPGGLSFGAVFEVEFVVQVRESVLYGKRFKSAFTIPPMMLTHERESRIRLEQMAAEMVLKALREFAAARPQAPESADWRPEEMIPEDFYAR